MEKSNIDAMMSLIDDRVAGVGSHPRFHGRMPFKPFCDKCGFARTKGVGCLQCKIEKGARKSEKLKSSRQSTKTKPVKKVDKRTKSYRNRLRSKTIWELAELVIALDSVLEYDEAGRVTFYLDQQEKASKLKSRVPEVMQNVRRAYELSKRYPTKTLKKIREEYPSFLRAYSQ